MIACPAWELVTERGWGDWGLWMVSNVPFLNLSASYMVCSLYENSLSSKPMFCTLFVFWCPYINTDKWELHYIVYTFYVGAWRIFNIYTNTVSVALKVHRAMQITLETTVFDVSSNLLIIECRSLFWVLIVPKLSDHRHLQVLCFFASLTLLFWVYSPVYFLFTVAN